MGSLGIFGKNHSTAALFWSMLLQPGGNDQFNNDGSQCKSQPLNLVAICVDTSYSVAQSCSKPPRSRTASTDQQVATAPDGVKPENRRDINGVLNGLCLGCICTPEWLHNAPLQQCHNNSILLIILDSWMDFRQNRFIL